ncbi:LysM peptidoglycan-binding domain-containing protein [Uliginosibacterium sp. H3]|uniref:LysM peptidoglycan-binding domain-containing protein n=1 Tax=Uliginosibacterium silvisoli TaxID=3114758 RepID=A0ABU6JZL8_9RHOO|nr:LysM peptidoglycan-binding domain-containing protein [Uliginosibacterium sp. H3]
MKRFSSALFLALAALTTGVTGSALAQAQSATASKDKLELADNAPDSYTVVKGDTLWGISGKFLKSPWRWPEIWKLNTEQIKNPHWIYPGQVVYLDRNGPNGPTLSLTAPGSQASPYEKLSPQVYSTPANALSAVPLQYIQALLIEPLVTDAADLANSGTVIALQEDRVVIGANSTVFARHLAPGQDAWSIYRPGTPIKDPINGEVLGYESVLVGNARVTTPENGSTAAALQVTKVKHEVQASDLLLPTGKETAFAPVPRPAPANLDAAVASIYGGLEQTGRFGIITINAGRDKYIEPGQVIGLDRYRGNATYRGRTGDEKAQYIPLPSERFGLAMVFRVFNRVSYAIVLDSSLPVQVGDSAVAP